MGLTASHGPELQGAHAWDEIHVDLSKSTGALDFQGLKNWIGKVPSGVKQWETQRDHAAVLELPSNLEQLAPEKRCVWLKRQHKKLARKWHPDKARGNKERAARKMREVSEAKEALVKRMSC